MDLLLGKDPGDSKNFYRQLGFIDLTQFPDRRLVHSAAHDLTRSKHLPRTKEAYLTGNLKIPDDTFSLPSSWIVCKIQSTKLKV